MTKRRKLARRKNNVGRVTKLPEQVSWVLLLPPELTFLILASCSNAMLVALAQTCKTFNTIALQVFFARGRGEFPTPAEGTLMSSRTPVEMLDATRIALFVKQLRFVDWSFKAGCECKIVGPQADPTCPFLPSASQTSTDIVDVARSGTLWRTFDEIANLQTLFSRIPDVGDVNLNFMLLDTWLNIILPWTHPELKGSALDPDLWMAFIDLLDKIVDNGCHRLVINNGEQLLKLFPGEDSRDSVSTSTSKRKHLNLQSLSVHSDILLRPPCFEWLLSLLTSSACANSLTRLLIRSQMTSLPSSLLASLNLPNLVEFEMQAAHTTLPYDQESTFAKFEDISAFLGTHNDSLKVVSLYGAELPPSTPKDSAAVSAFGLKKPILPKLGSFAAHPAYIAWLLDLAVHSQSRLTLGSLTTIAVKSEDCLPLRSIQPQHFDYASFNEALEALVSWQNGYRKRGKYSTRSRTKNKIFGPGRTIDLNLTFVCPHGIPEWFASHLPSAQGQTSPSILTQLTCVRNLAISTLFPATLQEEAIDVIPDWLALISNAGFSSNLSGPRRRGRPPKTGSGTPSELRLVELLSLGDFLGDKDQFIDRVAERCTGVKWVRTGFLRSDPAVNLDEFRARAGMENAEQ
ncbi:hypothetical protein GALMADRAFT_418645 [Galerina marginata CBS 339.88]|uniref:F-box domain-containing protein n=1 Tax=Galerina marginata (strain CBS 339.88) TaxID=685588 RepID=A0A067T3K4_GALM3|nr:hypothetical protein GALMADRAFT_418645 [Galerina marginata CBS 339.88]